MSRRYAAERIRKRIRKVWLDEAYRLIARRHQHHPLGSIPTRSRFADPLQQYSVLYAAESMHCAIWEGLARDRFTRQAQRTIAVQDAEEIAVVTLRTIEAPALVDLRDDGPAVRIGAPPAVAHNADHRAGQALSVATYRTVPEADGFVYRSRFTGHTCIAVFDRATAKLSVRDVTGLELPRLCKAPHSRGNFRTDAPSKIRRSFGRLRNHPRGQRKVTGTDRRRLEPRTLPPDDNRAAQSSTTIRCVLQTPAASAQ